MKNRILFLTHVTYIGGAEMFLLRFLKRIKKERFSPIVALPGEGNLAKRIRDMGIEVVIIKIGPYQRRNPFPHIRSIFNVYRTIRDKKIDILHSATRPAQYYGAWAAKLAGIPNICHFFDIIDWKDYMKFSNWSIRMADIVIAVSQAVRSCLIKGNILDKKIVLVHNGVDVVELNSNVNEGKFRRELNISKEDLLIGLVGRLVSEKGHRFFINAAANILKRIPGARFVIVGEEPSEKNDECLYTKELKSLCQKLKVGPNIIFTGFRKDVIEIISSLDILILASTFMDPLPTVVLEAMALGKPIIATNVGGVSEIVDDKINGLLVPPENANVLSKAIVDLLSDREKMKKMGIAGQKKIIRCFDISLNIKKIEGCYQRLLLAQFLKQKHISRKC